MIVYYFIITHKIEFKINNNTAHTVFFLSTDLRPPNPGVHDFLFFRPCAE